MKFDFKKLEKKVKFEPQGHTYTDENGDSYIPVTSLIGMYSLPFDSEKWSTYKAIKDIMNNAGIFERYKNYVGGWEKVYPYYTKHSDELDKTIVKQIKARKQYYLKEWDYEREHAAKLGTKQHDKKESHLFRAQRVRVRAGQKADVSGEDLLEIQNFYDGENQVFPELQLWNERYRISGKADVVERYGRDIIIRDYKTCKKIEFEPFMDEAMLEPLEQLPNTNYSKFTMQLSLYGWMLEELGFRVIGLVIEHIDRHTGKHIIDYPLAYRKDLIIKMLEHYDDNRIRGIS